jgi:hypothetical protein
LGVVDILTSGKLRAKEGRGAVKEANRLLSNLA